MACNTFIVQLVCVALSTSISCCRIVPAARRGEVDVSDLPLPSEQQAEPAFQEFDRNWDEAVAAGDPKLMKVRTLCSLVGEQPSHAAANALGSSSLPR